ncbi:hypothetical protein GYB62_00855 [bacterium]|nr:hypothetical protein [bacterium]
MIDSVKRNTAAIFGENPFRTVGWLVLLALCALCLISVLRIVSTLTYTPDVAQRPNAASASPSSQYDSAAIVERHIFGVADKDAPQDIEVEDLPETKLKLTLRGAFTASEKHLASAIIEDDKQKASTYRVGATLPGNAKLRAVYSDRVVLSRNGVLETLYFPTVEELAQTRRSSTSSRSTARRATTSTRSPRPSTTPNLTEMTSEDRKAAIQKRLEELRARNRERDKATK